MRRGKQPGESGLSFFAMFAGLIVLLGGPSACAGDSPLPHLVVVLYPDDNDGRPGNILTDRGIRTILGAADDLQIHNEYLDISRFQKPDYAQHLAQFLRQKLVGRKIDAVITGLAPSLDFAIEHRAVAFPGTPIVFTAVEEREVKARKLPPDVIGVPMRFDLADTLELALGLHPNTQQVFVIAGKAKFDLAWEAEARKVFRAYESRCAFTYLTALPMNALLNEVDHLPANSIIYYLHIFEDGAGKIYSPADALEAIAARANAPIYGHVDSLVGRGLVGGRVFSFASQGQHAGKLARRIAAGERPETIGIQEPEANGYLFDARALRRWGIREASLPAGSEVRFQEPNFWDLYRWHIIAVVSLCITEALLIAGLLVQRASRLRAEQRFRQIVEAAPNGMIMVSRDGQIVLANALVEKLFGYSVAELLGQKVEILVPEPARTQHPALREEFFTKPSIRVMGAGRELFARRKDGSEFPVEIGLSPVQTDEGRFVLASIIDITDRRQAEQTIRDNQRELRRMTGKLLQAQETERRRIARELHDDLSQRLALLCVQLDLLGQQPNASSEHLAGQAHELSAQAKALASSLHDLSRQLHPTKLEQLGLGAALGGLCKEMSQAHALPIEFAADPIPGRFPPDAALCLYRIVQEALRNVVRHSGAARADVKVRVDGDGIGMEISDDGVGFEPKSVDGRGGVGLVSMRERLHPLRGTMTIDTPPAGGTRIRIRVPTRPPNQPGSSRLCRAGFQPASGSSAGNMPAPQTWGLHQQADTCGAGFQPALGSGVGKLPTPQAARRAGFQPALGNGAGKMPAPQARDLLQQADVVAQASSLLRDFIQSSVLPQRGAPIPAKDILNIEPTAVS